MIIRGQKLDCALSADVPDFQVDGSLEICPECGEIGLFLGTLGDLRHFRCRYCGSEWHNPIPRTFVRDTVGDLERVRLVASALLRELHAAGVTAVYAGAPAHPVGILATALTAALAAVGEEREVRE